MNDVAELVPSRTDARLYIGNGTSSPAARLRLSFCVRTIVSARRRARPARAPRLGCGSSLPAAGLRSPVGSGRLCCFRSRLPVGACVAVRSPGSSPGAPGNRPLGWWGRAVQTFVPGWSCAGRVVLTVGKVGPANAGYYESQIVAGAEDYYVGEGDAPGVWVGRADLVGAVAGSLATAGDSKLLLEAKCAPDGSRLGKTTVSERSVTAFDLKFSAPKSASVLYALGDPAVSAAVEAAFTAAVGQAIASLSPRITHTRTGHAGAAVVDTDGVLGVSYRHRISRALDPQLHDHVLISNAVLAVPDGEWRTLDARGLYRNAKAAGVEFQSFFRSALGASLGVEFGDVDANGQADIVGIDQAVLDEFSTRRVDIEAALGGGRPGSWSVRDATRRRLRWEDDHAGHTTCQIRRGRTADRDAAGRVEGSR